MLVEVDVFNGIAPNGGVRLVQIQPDTIEDASLMIMQANRRDDDDFGDGVELSPSGQDGLATNSGCWRFVPLHPERSLIRIDSSHKMLPAPHHHKSRRETTIEVEIFGAELYFG